MMMILERTMTHAMVELIRSLKSLSLKMNQGKRESQIWEKKNVKMANQKNQLNQELKLLILPLIKNQAKKALTRFLLIWSLV